MQRPPVYFHFPEKPVSFPERTRLKALLAKLFKSEGKDLERLDYIFCSDSYLLQLNLEWLQHDTYTDIITFDLSDKNSATIGEVYISIDRVKENARTFQSAFAEELRRVIFHGALHLCGHKDKTKAQQSAMRELEGKWLKAYSRST